MKPIYVNDDDLEGAAGIEETPNFENDASQPGLLTTESQLSKEQITEIQGWWKKFFGGGCQ
jgi:hypothetical protein